MPLPAASNVFADGSSLAAPGTPISFNDFDGSLKSGRLGRSEEDWAPESTSLLRLAKYSLNVSLLWRECRGMAGGEVSLVKCSPSPSPLLAADMMMIFALARLGDGAFELQMSAALHCAIRAPTSMPRMTGLLPSQLITPGAISAERDTTTNIREYRREGGEDGGGFKACVAC